MQKVFCIGLPKTGTTSIGKAFEILGYRHNSYTDSILGIRSLIDGTYDYVNDQISRYDAFEDVPYNFIYKYLDQVLDAKFILTKRSCGQKYLESLLNEPERKKQSPIHHFKKLSQFGVHCVEGNEKIVLDYYSKHNRQVDEYFKGKSNYITMCLEEDNNWDILCSFLNCDIPDQPFPHLNKSFVDNV